LTHTSSCTPISSPWPGARPFTSTPIRLPHRREEGPRHYHAAYQGDPRQQPRQPDRYAAFARRPARPRAAGPRTRRFAAQRRSLPASSATTSRSPAPPSSTRTVLVFDGFSQGLRHDRLAARLRARATQDHRGDDQAPAVQLRLRAEHRSACGRRGVGLRCVRHRRGLSQQARPALWRAKGPLRAGKAGRCLLHVPQGARGEPPPNSWPRRSATSSSSSPATYSAKRIPTSVSATPPMIGHRPRHRDSQSPGASFLTSGTSFGVPQRVPPHRHKINRHADCG